MSNSYYNSTFTAAIGTLARSSTLRSQFSLVEAGFTAAEAAFAPKANPSFTGNVGIGTATPGAKLEVSGASNAAEFRLRSTDTTPANIRAYVNGAEAGKLSFLSGGTLVAETVGNERLRIDSSGNLGVGTTTPGSRIQARSAGTSTYGGGTQISAISTGANNTRIALSADNSNAYIIMGGSAANPALVVANNDGSSEHLRISNTGVVTILGANPLRPVTINNGISVKGDSGDWALAYSFSGNAGTDRGGFGAYGNADTLAYYYWIGQSYASPQLVVQPSGGVGVGTSGPDASAILDVQSTTKGLRLPNMTTAQKNAIASPAAGLMVFDTTLGKACLYTGAAWQTITSS